MGGVAVVRSTQFSMLCTLSGIGSSSTTANSALLALPAGTTPSSRVQRLPAVGAGQTQPGEERVGLKVVKAGTVSRKVTPAAPWLPELA